MIPEVREIHDRASRLAEQARSIMQTADEEGRDMTSEEEENFDNCHREVERLNRHAERLKRQDRLERDAVEARQKEERARQAAARRVDPGEQDRILERGFGRFLRGQPLSVEDRQAQQAALLVADPELRGMVEARQQGTTPDSAGGYLVPEGFMNELEKAMVPFSGMMEAARVIRTSSGNPLPQALVDDTGNVGAIVGENPGTPIAPVDIVYTQVILGAYMYTSNMVLVSVQLMQDSAFGMEAHVNELLAERLGRILNRHFTTGTGSSQPHGVAVAAPKVLAGQSAAAGVTWDLLVDMEHTVNRAHRRSPSCRWMFEDTTLAAIKKVKFFSGSDATPEFAWQQSLVPGEPATILGYPYTVNDDCDDFTSGNEGALIFGDFSKYHIRQVQQMFLFRFGEKYMDHLQIGFMAYGRWDGKLKDAGSGPIKALGALAA